MVPSVTTPPVPNEVTNVPSGLSRATLTELVTSPTWMVLVSSPTTTIWPLGSSATPVALL